jgi:hypothetical protein
VGLRFKKSLNTHKYGEIRRPCGGKLPSGRAGNHRSQGWFVVTGSGIQPATGVHGFRTLDLVPTVFR